MKITEFIEINGKKAPRTRDMTQEEEKEYFNSLNQTRITELKQQLADTNDKAIEYAEGWISEEEYEPIKIQRQAWREEINRLESGDI